MTECPKCAGHLCKVHRHYYERLGCAAAYACRKCNFRVRRFYRWWYSFRFVFSLRSRCVRCGTSQVQRVNDRDRIDSVSKHPLSLLQQILGAPLNKCSFCRLRYYDLRLIERVPANQSVKSTTD